MEEKQISEQESLLIIQQMIHTAKQEQKDDGRGWIVWGWLIFFASLFTYINLQFEWVSGFFFWNVFGAVTILFMLFETGKHVFVKRKEQVRTYTKDVFDKLNSGFFISLALIIVSINVGVPPTKGFALLLGLYGFWILIYGALLNFKPSIIGAYITWLLAFASLFVSSFEHTMLLHAAAVMCGYIIPGHIANNEFKKVNQQKSRTGV